MHPTKIHLKVCGMRDAENITALAKLQPDFIGFIFHETSPRYCEKIPKTDIPGNIAKTGVFVNKPLAYISLKKADFQLDYIQLHGSENPEFCREVSRAMAPVIKAFNLHPGFDFSRLKAYAPFCDFFLFDASGPKAGGNGIAFDWELLKLYEGETPFLLSGGIDETRVAEIKKINHPAFYGVDINSRFEIGPGLKDIDKIKRFKHAIQS